jgi:hypothetical protein
MTAHKHLKEMVRARMHKTGESYTTARRHIVSQVEVLKDFSPTRWHLPGNIPATTALRILLASRGIPVTEALLFGICGGIGMGLASFYYEKGDIATFYIGGRHLWHDDLEYFKSALKRFGIEPTVTEGAKARPATPCIAWVDMAELPHRGMPSFFSGGAYHVITVYQFEEKSSALIGDLTDVPIEIPGKQLAAARTRIKQFKSRLLTIPASGVAVDLPKLVRSGLQACHQGLRKSAGKGAANMSGLEMLQKCEEQLAATTGKESWTVKFARGHRLWTGLTSIYDFIENYHTGGGLCRPLFAECLSEAARLPGLSKLVPLAKRYAELGDLWTDLAMSAIPQSVPAFREVHELCMQRVELRTGGEPGDVEKIRGVWARLSEMQKASSKNFPLSESECAKLQETLRRKVAALREAELAARATLGEVIA